MRSGPFYPKRFIPWKNGQSWYDYYNEKYFGHKLPVVYVGFYKMRDAYGATYKLGAAEYVSHIALNPYFKNWGDILRITLLHEMIHVKLNCRGGHGSKFQRELKRLIKMGAFDDILS